MSGHTSSTSVLRDPEGGGHTSNNQAAQSHNQPRPARRSQIMTDVYAAFFELIGTVGSSPAPWAPWPALTSRWIPDSVCYVRPRRHSEYCVQPNTHWCDLCRPTPVHFGVDGFLPVIHGLALREVRNFEFERPLN